MGSGLGLRTPNTCKSGPPHTIEPQMETLQKNEASNVNRVSGFCLVYFLAKVDFVNTQRNYTGDDF